LHAETEARRETVSRCVTSKRMVTKWFLDWYWQAFEGDISSALGLITAGGCTGYLVMLFAHDNGLFNLTPRS
jgi:hypothetical protein